MNLDTKCGEKIVYKNTTSGWERDRNLAAQYLTKESMYTVDRVEVGDWKSHVYLLEIPGVPRSTRFSSRTRNA